MDYRTVELLFTGDSGSCLIQLLLNTLWLLWLLLRTLTVGYSWGQSEVTGIERACQTVGIIESLCWRFMGCDIARAARLIFDCLLRNILIATFLERWYECFFILFELLLLDWPLAAVIQLNISHFFLTTSLLKGSGQNIGLCICTTRLSYQPLQAESASLYIQLVIYGIFWRNLHVLLEKSLVILVKSVDVQSRVQLTTS